MADPPPYSQPMILTNHPAFRTGFGAPIPPPAPLLRSSCSFAQNSKFGVRRCQGTRRAFLGRNLQSAITSLFSFLFDIRRSTFAIGFISHFGLRTWNGSLPWNLQSGTFNFQPRVFFDQKHTPNTRTFARRHTR